MASFFYCGRLSSAQLVPLQGPQPAPGRTDGVPERHQRQWIINPSLQVVDKGIRQKSTKEWTHSLTAVPFVRGHRSVFPRTPRNTGVYTRHPMFVTATSGVLTRLPAKLSKNRMRVYTLSDRQSEKKLRVYTASEAKGLRKVQVFIFGSNTWINLVASIVLVQVLASSWYWEWVLIMYVMLTRIW